MRIAVVSNWRDRLGLYREAKLLCEFLENSGHNTFALQYDAELPPDLRLDLMIALESHCEQLLAGAPERWLFPNPEFFTPDMIPAVERSYQRILCKTRAATEIFKRLYPEKTHYVGFLSHDIYLPEVTRVPEFFHLGGNSALRNTEAIVDAWKWKLEGNGIPAKLHLVSRVYKGPVPDNVDLIDEFVPEDALRTLQNRCLYHLCPSATEGFGHSVRESILTGNVVLLSNRPPLDEIDCHIRVYGSNPRKVGMATAYDVDARDIHLSALRMMASYNATTRRDVMYREAVLEGNARFEENMAKMLDRIRWSPTASGVRIPYKKALFDEPKRIAFMGNFGPEFSTENELKWSFEWDGHIVDPIQESNVLGLDAARVASNYDLFFWVRTPGYLKIGDKEMHVFLEELQKLSVPSVSYHLDRFWDIKSREEAIGQDAFWKSEYVFTADGGNQPRFLERGVNHIWLPPAVALRGCYPGNRKEDLMSDVGFVGAVDGYHAEYPERRALIEHMKHYFGPRFRIYRGVRGQDLNDVYASVKVCVGDSIFAHQADKSGRYWSDRVPETTGRGGILVHPRVEGLNYVGGPSVVMTNPGDFQGMTQAIDNLLVSKARRVMRDAGMRHVQNGHTYTKRIRTVLAKVGLKYWSPE